MKKSKLIILIVVFLFIISCNFDSNRSLDTKAVESLIVTDTKVESNSLNKGSWIQDEQPTTGQLYSIVETKLKDWSKIKFDSSTIVKHYSNKIGENDHEISCYFSKDHLISVENRITKKNGDDVSFMMFHFDDKNNCFANYRKDNEKDTARFYFHINNCIIEYDYKLRPFIVDSLKKQQVIQETKLSLETNMQRFPEFKYIFNWK